SLGLWTQVGTLPSVAAQMAGARWADRYYVGGGVLDEADGYAQLATVHSAQIHPDGSLGAWRSETAMPRTFVPRFFAVKGRLYLDNGNENSLYSAPIFADGSLGAWALEAPVAGYDLSSIYGSFSGDRLWTFGG